MSVLIPLHKEYYYQDLERLKSVIDKAIERGAKSCLINIETNDNSVWCNKPRIDFFEFSVDKLSLILQIENQRKITKELEDQLKAIV